VTANYSADVIVASYAYNYILMGKAVKTRINKIVSRLLLMQWIVAYKSKPTSKYVISVIAATLSCVLNYIWQLHFYFA